MRYLLYSEISQIEGIPNIPEYLDRAIEAARGLCKQLLEPLHHPRPASAESTTAGVHRFESIMRADQSNKNSWRYAWMALPMPYQWIR